MKKLIIALLFCAEAQKIRLKKEKDFINLFAEGAQQGMGYPFAVSSLPRGRLFFKALQE